MSHVAVKDKTFSVKLITDICFFIYLFTEFMFKHSILGQVGIILLMLSVSLLILSTKRLGLNFYFSIMLIFIFYSWIIARSEAALNTETSMSILMTVIFNTIVMFFVYNYLILRANINLSIKIFIYSALTFTIVSFIAEFESIFVGRLGGENGNMLGIVASISFVMCFYYFLKDFKLNHYFFIMNFLLLNVLLTGTRKGLLLILISCLLMVYFMYPGKRIRNILLAITSGISGYLIITLIPFFYNVMGSRIEQLVNYVFSSQVEYGSSVHSRMILIDLGWDYIYAQPWQGYGLGSFIYLPLSGGTYSHNNFIELLFTGGVIGTLVYYSVYVVVLIKGIHLVRVNRMLPCLFLSLTLGMLFIDYAWVSYIERIPLTVLMYFLAIITMTKSINQNVLKEEVIVDGKN